MGHRMSSLPVAEYCGQSPVLAAKHGAGRAAAMSSAVHAVFAGQPDADAKLARLTADERAEVRTWLRPVPHTFANGDVFDYDACSREVEVSVRNLADEPLTVGHPDAFTVIGRTLYVLDMKRSTWTLDPENLQNVAYAFGAFARYEIHEIDGFVCGLWSLTEGRYVWGERHDLHALETHDLYSRVKAAATNDGWYSTGEHCTRCWQRGVCPEWLLPDTQDGTALAPLSTPGGLTRDNFVQLRLKADAMRTLADRADEILKAFATAEGPIPDGKGKVYAMVETQGRESVAVKDLRAAMGADAEQYIRRGKPFMTARWVKQ